VLLLLTLTGRCEARSTLCEALGKLLRDVMKSAEVMTHCCTVVLLDYVPVLLDELEKACHGALL
jgi:hypothetical protein